MDFRKTYDPFIITMLVPTLFDIFDDAVMQEGVKKLGEEGRHEYSEIGVYRVRLPEAMPNYGILLDAIYVHYKMEQLYAPGYSLAKVHHGLRELFKFMLEESGQERNDWRMVTDARRKHYTVMETWIEDFVAAKRTKGNRYTLREDIFVHPILETEGEVKQDDETEIDTCLACAEADYERDRFRVGVCPACGDVDDPEGYWGETL